MSVRQYVLSAARHAKDEREIVVQASCLQREPQMCTRTGAPQLPSTSGCLSRSLEGVIGFMNINKPPGMTSHDVVAAVRRCLGRGVKVGHAGTLDPFAQGVLVICLGKATRLAEYVQHQPKRYRAGIILGASSETDDPQGPITPMPDATPPAPDQLADVLATFVGTIQQTPPAHSAVHVEGQRAYKLARAGEEVRMAPRPVTIHSIELLGYEYPRFDMDVSCGSGTYIRSLARDIGAACGSAAYCRELVRTAIGSFTLERAVGLDSLDIARDLIEPLAGLAGMPRVTIDSHARAALVMGKTVAMDHPVPPGELVVVDEQGVLVAIAMRAGGPNAARSAVTSENAIRPTKVLVD